MDEHEVYDDLPATRSGVFQYIETFYNHKRIHQNLGYQTPNQYEAENATASKMKKMA